MTTDLKVQQDIGEDLGYLSIWEIGVTFVLLCIITTVYLYGLYLRVEYAEKDRKLIQAINPRIEENIQRQKNSIEILGWADPEQELVRVPISGAMQAAAAMLKQDQRSLPVTSSVATISVAKQPGASTNSQGTDNVTGDQAGAAGSASTQGSEQ